MSIFSNLDWFLSHFLGYPSFLGNFDYEEYVSLKGVEDPNEALKLLTDKPFDLVFLDVDMPGMTGFELCAKLRKMPQHKKTPVLFVTALSDFDSRTSSTMAGGNDFIAKPFLFIELTVKALMHIFRGKLQPKVG